MDNTDGSPDYCWAEGESEFDLSFLAENNRDSDTAAGTDHNHNHGHNHGGDFDTTTTASHRCNGSAIVSNANVSSELITPKRASSRPAPAGLGQAQGRGAADQDIAKQTTTSFLGNAASNLGPLSSATTHHPSHLAAPRSSRPSPHFLSQTKHQHGLPQALFPVTSATSLAWDPSSLIATSGPAPRRQPPATSAPPPSYSGFNLPINYGFQFSPMVTLPPTFTQWSTSSPYDASSFLSPPLGVTPGLLAAPFNQLVSTEYSGSAPTNGILFAESGCKPPPSPAGGRGERASTVPTDSANPNHTDPSPSSLIKRRKPSQAQSESIEFIQYRPGAGAGDKLSKKRPASDEETSRRSVSKTLVQKHLLDRNGDIQGSLITMGRRSTMRKPFTEQKRLETARARKEGVCDRCKRSKRKCNLAQNYSPYEPCSLCAGSRTYKGVPRMPCSRSDIKDVSLFRKGPAPNEPLYTPRLLHDLADLADLSARNVEVRTLHLTQKLGGHRLTVYASEFCPLPNDVVSYKWKDYQGNGQEMLMPNFCLTNITKVTDQFRDYITSAKRQYLDSLRSEDELAWMTVDMAVRYAKRKPDSLVAIALDLWAVSRMIEIPWEMCGNDTLGVEQIQDPANPHHGKIPIPPIMDTQLDQIVIQAVLVPMRDELVEKFDKITAPPKPGAWFETYLTAFILLNHIERLAKHSVFHARLHTMRTKYSNKEFLEGAFHTAKIILSRFHFVCNGSAPLKLDWKLPTTISMAKLEPEQVAFMERTQEIIRERENNIRSLQATNNYERCLYWSHQLFFEKWDSTPARVVDVY